MPRCSGSYRTRIQWCPEPSGRKHLLRPAEFSNGDEVPPHGILECFHRDLRSDQAFQSKTVDDRARWAGDPRGYALERRLLDPECPGGSAEMHDAKPKLREAWSACLVRNSDPDLGRCLGADAVAREAQRVDRRRCSALALGHCTNFESWSHIPVEPATGCRSNCPWDRRARCFRHRRSCRRAEPRESMRQYG